MGRAGSCSGGQVVFHKTCLLMGLCSATPAWLFGLRQPSPGAYRLCSGVNGSLREGSHQRVLPRSAAAIILASAVSHSYSLPLQETL